MDHSVYRPGAMVYFYFPAILRIRIGFYSDPDPGSAYGSGSQEPLLMRIRADPDLQHCFPEQ